MGDIVDEATRSRMMSGIRGKNTRPEMGIRRGLHARGLRFRLHGPGLPGRPDIVFSPRRAAVFINGCFWHGHDCHLFRWPASREEFWKAKIGRTQQRDEEVRQALTEAGWRHLTLWECALRGRAKVPEETLLDTVEAWVLAGTENLVIEGARSGPC